MIVVHFKKIHSSHDCWGKYEPYETTEVREFSTTEGWLRYKQTNKTLFVALYEVSKVVREVNNG